MQGASSKTEDIFSKHEFAPEARAWVPLTNTTCDDLIDEHDIQVGVKNVPTIWYFDEAGKKHRHYVDIFIPSKNLCIECKSTWTFNKKEDNIFLKQNAAKELGYNYEIWLYDGKGKLVDKHIWVINNYISKIIIYPMLLENVFGQHSGLNGILSNNDSWPSGSGKDWLGRSIIAWAAFGIGLPGMIVKLGAPHLEVSK